MVDFTGGTWRSLIDGLEVSVAIPDSVNYHYDASQDSRSLGSQESIPDIKGDVDLDDGTQVTLVNDGINSDQSYETDGVDDYLRFNGDSIAPPWTFIAVIRIESSNRQTFFDRGGGGLGGSNGALEFVDPENDIRYRPTSDSSDDVEITDFNAVNNSFILVVEQLESSSLLRLRDDSVSEASESADSAAWGDEIIDFFRDERDQRYVDGLTAEIAIADSEFGSELQDFEDELLQKWGIN